MRKITVQLLVLFVLLSFQSCIKSRSADIVQPSDEDNEIFAFQIKTKNASDVFKIYRTQASKTYDYIVDWGDGNTETIKDLDASHTYATAQEYTIKIKGVHAGISFIDPKNLTDENNMFITVKKWSNYKWEFMQMMFKNCKNFKTIEASDIPDVSNVQNFRQTFQGATQFNGDISKWNVGKATDISYMFQNASAFNQNINNWNTSNVTQMNQTFEGATSFSGNFSGWNFDKVYTYSSFVKGSKVLCSDLPQKFVASDETGCN